MKIITDTSTSFIFLILSISLLTSCQTDPPPLTPSCETVEYIMERDQRYRQKYASVMGGSFLIFDSLLKEQGIEEGYKGKDKLASEVIDSLSEKAYFLNLDNHGMKQHQLDSIWDLQSKLDRENTLSIIDMINREADSVWFTKPFKCARKSFTAFVHCPEDLMDEVKISIDKLNLEVKGPYQYRHIMWHLTGRSPDFWENN